MKKSKFMTRLEDMSWAERQAFLNAYPHHLAKNQEAKQLKKLLIDFDFLEAKIKLGSLSTLISDYDLAEPFFKKPSLPTIQAALRLSVDRLNQDKNQLASQLWGQLFDQEAASIRKLLNQAALAQKVWLRPMTASLTEKTQNALYAEHTTPDYPVMALAMSPDSKIVVSGNAIGALSAWSVATGEKLFDFDPLDEGVFHAGVLSIFVVKHERFGDMVISCCIDGNIAHWSLETGELIDVYRSTRDISDKPARAFDISTTGAYLVMGYENDLIEVFMRVELDRNTEDAETEKFCIRSVQLLGPRKNSSSWVHSIAFSIDKLTIYASFSDCFAVFSYSKKQDLIVPINMEKKLGAQSVLSFQTRFLIIASRGVAVVKDMAPMNPGGEESFTFTYGNNEWTPHCLAVSPIDNYLVLGFSSGLIEIVSFHSHSKIQSFIGHSDTVYAVAISVDGRKCISASQGGMRFWNIPEKEIVETEIKSVNLNGNIDISTDGRFALTVDSNRGVDVWSVEGTMTPQKHSSYEITNIGEAQFCPFTSRFVSYLTGEGFIVWNFINKEIQCCISDNEDWFVHIYTISGDGKWIIASIEDVENSTQEIYLFELISESSVITSNSSVERRALPYKGSLIKKIEPLRNSSLFFTLSSDGEICVYRPFGNDGPELLKHYVNSSVTAFKASRYQDSLLVASKSKDIFATPSVDLWEYDKATQRFVPRILLVYPFVSDGKRAYIHKTIIYDVALSANGRFLITCSNDCYVCVWDTFTRDLVTQFIGLNGFNKCAITPDNTKIILMDDEGKVHMLYLHLPKELKEP